MGNLSKSKLKLYICDNKLRSCAQFAPGANVHRVLICSTEFAPKHRLYDQNTPQVQINTPGVYLHRGVCCAYKRGFRVFYKSQISMLVQQDKNILKNRRPAVKVNDNCNNYYF